MTLQWSIGLMTGTVNDGYIDIAALRTDGSKIVEFGPFELFPYEDKEIKKLIFKTYEEAKKWNFDGPEPNIFSITEKQNYRKNNPFFARKNIIFSKMTDFSANF